MLLVNYYLENYNQAFCLAQDAWFLKTFRWVLYFFNDF